MSGSAGGARRAGAGGRRGRGLALGVVLALAAAAFLVRVVPLRAEVLRADGEVRLLGLDAYYHVRHAGFAARHFPHLQRTDVGTHYPTGEHAKHPGLFTLAIAGLAVVGSGGSPEAADVWRAAAWLPPVLGALSIPALAWAAWPWLGPGGAVLACLLYALYPGHALDRTLLGAADHHAAEIPLALLAVGAVVRALAGARRRRGVSVLRPALVHALPLGAFAFTWLGAPIHVALAGLGIGAVVLAEVARGGDPGPEARAAVRLGLGLALWLAVPALVLPDLVLDRSGHRGMLAAAAGLAAGPALAAWIARRLAARGVGPRARAGALAAAAAALGALLGLVPDVRDALGLVLDPKTQAVTEHRPVEGDLVWALVGPVGVMAAAVVPLALRAVWRGAIPLAGLHALVVALATVALWWRTLDYGYGVPPFLALIAAAGLLQLRGDAGAPLRRGWAAVAFALAAAVLVLPIAPLATVRSPWPAPALRASVRLFHDGWAEALRFLREETPEPTLAVDARLPERPGRFGTDATEGPVEGVAYPAGTYGVMGAWDFGSFVAAVGRRVPVWSHGVSGRTARWLVSDREDESLALLCPDCRGPERVRWAVVSAESVTDHFLGKARLAGLPEALFRDRAGSVPWEGREVPLAVYGRRHAEAIGSRLWLDDGSGLGHYRLLFESHHESVVAYTGRVVVADGRPVFRSRLRSIPIDSAATRARWEAAAAHAVVETPAGWAYGVAFHPSVKVFEIVAGARLVGRAPPGERVEARLALETRGRAFAWRGAVRAGADGGFALRVPWPSAGGAGEVAVRGPWRVRAGGLEREVAVSEAAVAAGRDVSVGALVEAAGAAGGAATMPVPGGG